MNYSVDLHKYKNSNHTICQSNSGVVSNIASQPEGLSNVMLLLNIYKNHQPFVVIAVGKIGDYKNIGEALLKREFDPRPRKEDLVKKL